MKITISKDRRIFIILFVLHVLFLVTVNILEDVLPGGHWVMIVVIVLATVNCLALLLHLVMMWRCYSCKKHTIIIAPHCLRCGARLSSEEEVDVL